MATLPHERPDAWGHIIHADASSTTRLDAVGMGISDQTFSRDFYVGVNISQNEAYQNVHGQIGPETAEALAMACAAQCAMLRIKQIPPFRCDLSIVIDRTSILANI